MNRSLSPTRRTQLRRHPERAQTERAALHALLDACTVVHVAVPGPRLLPMAFGRRDDTLYLHGAMANDLLRRALEGEVCLAATRVDGLVLAKSPFHHSMNYRSATVFGRPREVHGDEKRAALDAILEHNLPGRTAECRANTAAELKATRVLALDMDEAAVKVRSGPPRDNARDLGLPHWSGVVPLHERTGIACATSEEPPPRSVVRATLARSPALEGPRTVALAGGAITFDGSPQRIDFPRVHAWLRDDAYWIDELSEAALLRRIQPSYVAGAYAADGVQLAFARVVADGQSFAWLGDVYVAREARGRGIGKSFVGWLVDHPAFESVKRWILATRDAQPLYLAHGFRVVAETEAGLTFMER